MLVKIEIRETYYPIDLNYVKKPRCLGVERRVEENRVNR